MADLALKSLGVACAFGSAWFAAYMLAHQGGAPRVNAIEDFAIFAQPNRIHAVEAAVKAAAIEDDPRRIGRAITIDMTPIGVATSRESPKAEPPRQDVRIVEMNSDEALIETPEGFRRLKVGDEIQEIGKIISIRRMGDYWVLVASRRSLAQAVPPAERSPSQP